MATYKIVLLRHGESTYNDANKFCGWYDADLSEKGNREAIDAGNVLLKEGYKFDVAFTSMLKRAIRTLWHVLDKTDQMVTSALGLRFSCVLLFLPFFSGFLLPKLGN